MKELILSWLVQSLAEDAQQEIEMDNSIELATFHDVEQLIDVDIVQFSLNGKLYRLELKEV